MPAALTYSTNRATTQDNEFSLLAKLVIAKGGVASPSDNEASLLAKAVRLTVNPVAINLLASYDIADEANIDSFNRTVAAGYTGVDGVAFAQEAAIDELRGAHYVGGVPCVLLESDPTPQTPSGVSVTDNFDSYGDFAQLGSQANWTAVNGTAVVLNASGTAGAVRGDTNAVNIIAYTGEEFDPEAWAEVELTSGGLNSSGVGCRCDPITGNGYFFFTSTTDSTYFGIMILTVDGDYNDAGFVSNIGDKLRMRATGSGSATRVQCQKDTGSGWVDVFTDLDPGLGKYLDGGYPAVVSYSNTGSTCQIDNFAAYDP